MSTPGKPQCTATSKRTGKRCGRDVTPGMTVCYYHGSATKASKRKAVRNLALGEAMAAIAEERALGRVLPVEPAEAMLEMVREAAGNVAVLRHLVQTLTVDQVEDPDPEVDGDGQIERGALAASIAGLTGSEAKRNEAAPHVWVVMYNDERERLVRWSKACRDAGVDERRLELAEGQARMLATVLRGAAEALLVMVLGLAGDRRDVIEAAWREQWPGIARAQLAAISTTEAPE